MNNKGMAAIDGFLNQWKENALNFYRNLRTEYEKAINWNQYKEQAKAEGLITEVEIDNYAAKKAHTAKKRFIDENGKGAIELITGYGKDFEKNLSKTLDKEVEYKRKKLITRIENKAGKIQNASGLCLGDNGEINGTIIGDNATVRVQTVYAGGYNIQCLHYRVLVK